jgi:hypothetical protein
VIVTEEKRRSSVPHLKNQNLSTRPLSRTDLSYMIQRRATDADLETAIRRHTFRVIVITDYLKPRLRHARKQGDSPQLVMPEATDKVVIHHSGSLHEGVTDS